MTNYDLTYPLPLTGIDVRKALIELGENPNKCREEKIQKVMNAIFEDHHTLFITLPEFENIFDELNEYLTH